jgi:hypothetical protein
VAQGTEFKPQYHPKKKKKKKPAGAKSYPYPIAKKYKTKKG